MAAGKSTRMYPITLTQPKPLVHIANKPILAHQLDQLVGLVDEVILIVGYKRKMLEEAFGDLYRGIALGYVEQKEQLGTGHAAMQAAPYVKDRFLLMNGDDLYARRDIEACLHHTYTLTAQAVPDVRPFSEVVLKHGLVTDVIEKPENPASNLASIGLFALDKKIFTILEDIPKSPRGEYELPDAVIKLLHIVDMHCHVVDDYWIPVGYPWHVLNANDFLLENYFEEAPRAGTIAESATLEGRVRIGEHASIQAGAVIRGNVVIGRQCEIGPNCVITGNTALGDHCALGAGAVVDNCVIDRHSRIEPYAVLSHSVIGDHVTIGSGTVTMSDAVDGPTVTSMIKGKLTASDRPKFGATIASRVMVEPHVTTRPGVKIGPEQTIEAGSVVNDDIE